MLAGQKRIKGMPLSVHSCVYFPLKSLLFPNQGRAKCHLPVFPFVLGWGGAGGGGQISSHLLLLKHTDVDYGCNKQLHCSTV